MVKITKFVEDEKRQGLPYAMINEQIINIM